MTASYDKKPRWLSWLARVMREINLSYSEVWRYRGRKFLVTEMDREDWRFVVRIVSERRQALAAGQTPARLVTFRQEFRGIADYPRIVGMLACLELSDDEIARLAIWLMGRKGARFAIPFIAPFGGSFDVSVRRDVARALRRLKAWSELRAIAEQDPDERVRCLATAASLKPFDQRLEQFAGEGLRAASLEASRHSMPFFVRIPIGPGQPAKTSEFIRTLLERIRKLVRGL